MQVPVCVHESIHFIHDLSRHYRNPESHLLGVCQTSVYPLSLCVFWIRVWSLVNSCTRTCCVWQQVWRANAPRQALISQHWPNESQGVIVGLNCRAIGAPTSSVSHFLLRSNSNQANLRWQWVGGWAPDNMAPLLIKSSGSPDFIVLLGLHSASSNN